MTFNKENLMALIRLIKYLPHQYSQPMNEQTIKVMSKKYKHFADPRTANQIELTLKLSRALTQNNLHRLQQPSLAVSEATKRLKERKFIYVYCCGTPPFEKEAQNLPFEGQCIFLKYTPLQMGVSEEVTKKQPILSVQWAKILNERINSISTTKPIIIAFHSFGVYIASTYLHMFPSKRIIGLMDLGGLPLRFSKEIQELMTIFEPLTVKMIEESLDQFYALYLEQIRERIKKGDKSVNNNVLENKYQLLALVKVYKDQKRGVPWIFERQSQWPNILKCFVYGRDDTLIAEQLLSEKAIFYTYQKPWNPEYKKIVEQAFFRLRGKRVDNVQERMVFSIEGGPHIMHMKKKYKQVIGKISEEYLALIEEIYQLQESKL